MLYRSAKTSCFITGLAAFCSKYSSMTFSLKSSEYGFSSLHLCCFFDHQLFCSLNRLRVLRGVPKGKKNSTIFGRAFVYSSFRVQLLQNFGRSSNQKTRQDLVEFSITQPSGVVWNIRKTRVCLVDLIRIISTVDQEDRSIIITPVWTTAPISAKQTH